MNKNLGWKVILTLAVIVVFIVGIFGIPSSFSGQGIVDSLKKQIRLGLDLKGGIHLILQVKVNEAVKVDSDNAAERIKDALRRRKISYTDVSQPDPVNHPETIVVKGVPPESSSDLRSIVQDSLSDYSMTSGPNDTYTVSMKPQSLKDLKDRAVDQAIDTISHRIDTLGVTSPTIQRHGLGDYQILVQLPGVDDLARVKEIIQSTAMLEIRQGLGGPYTSQQDALQQHNGLLPPDAMLLPGKSSSANGGEEWYLVSRMAPVTGRDLRDARPSTDENGQPSVSFTLTGEAGRRFAAFTSSHIGDNLAVVLDNRVQEVAVIRGQISDQGEISGHMTEQDAKDLSMILKSGALPAGMTYLEERTVGPSLGSDSIREGVTATVVGFLAVLIFMLVYYGGAGVNADVALILNLIILLGFMGYSGAVLTLPGIAGVILTVGMGVDSNVLIFERIREELRNGKTPPSAVDQGFSHAWTAIFDTHVTTIVSAAILFIFGTGPVKGFATTLTLGLLANLFTAVFVSRIIFDWVLSRKQRGEALSV